MANIFKGFFEKLFSLFNGSNFVAGDTTTIIKSSVADYRSKDYLKVYEQVSWVYSAVKAIANTIACVNWRLYQIDGEEWEEIQEHDFLTLLNNPNPFLSRFELMYLTVSSLELVGEALWYIPRKGQRMLGIFPLNPAYLEIEIYNGLPKKFIYSTMKEKINLKPEELIFFKYPNPSNPYRGVSPLKAIALTVDSDYYASIWNRNFFINSATPAAVLETPNKLTKEDAEKLKIMLREFYSGIDKSHATMILSGGIQFKPIQLSQKDMEFLELRRFTRSEIAAAFGVPLSKLGISEEVNRATAYVNDYTFAKNTITPKLVMLRDAINRFLANYVDENVYYDFDSIIPEDEEFEVQKYVNFVKEGILTINEVRAELGFPEVPWGDTPFNPNLMMNFGFQGTNKEQSKPKSVFKSQFERLRYWKAFIEKKQKTEDNFKGKVANMFEKQRLRVLKNLSEALKEKGYQAGVKKMSQAEIEKILEEVLSFLYASDEEQAWKMLYMSEQAKNFINSSIDIAGDFGLPMVFETDSPFITELMSERAQRFAKKISDTTYNQLKQSLLEGFLAGESESKLAERVNDVMTLAKRQRAQTIARTETFSVVNQAHIETYRMNGVEWKEWLTAGDERVRDMHVAADGQITKLDDYFNVGGEYLMYPGDPNGSPENIINCRCVSLPVIS
jgi:HK97 family phage portal protein